jgi:hypothetical protein
MEVSQTQGGWDNYLQQEDSFLSNCIELPIGKIFFT